MLKTVTGENGPTHLGLGPPHRVLHLFQNRNYLKWKAMFSSISLDLLSLILSWLSQRNPFLWSHKESCSIWKLGLGIIDQVKSISLSKREAIRPGEVSVLPTPTQLLSKRVNLGHISPNSDQYSFHSAQPHIFLPSKWTALKGKSQINQRCAPTFPGNITEYIFNRRKT